MNGSTTLALKFIPAAMLACFASAFAQQPATDPCGCKDECPEPVGYVLPKMDSGMRLLDKPVRLVVPFAAGGPTDAGARRLAEKLSKSLGQPVIVENKPGGNGITGAESVAKAAPDGHTFLYSSSTSLSINSHLLKQEVALDPVALVSEQPYALVVNPSLNVKTARELVAHAKSKPGSVSFASTGTGSFSHLAGEMFKKATQIDATHVPFRGSAPALTDVLAGTVPAAFLPVGQVTAYVSQGKLRVLGVTGKSATPLMPGVAPLNTEVPGYVVRSWTGVMAPRGTPLPIVAKLNMAINQTLADKELSDQFKIFGETACGDKGPGAFGAHLGAEGRKWRAMLDATGIRAER